MTASSQTRRTILILVSLVALVAAGCNTVGSRGTLAPRSPDSGTIAPSSPEPTAPVGSPSPEPTAPVGSPDPVDPGATPTARPPATPRPSATPSGATSVKVYLFAGESLVPVLRRVEATRAVGRAALTELLAGPTAEEAGASPALGTTIPAGTILLGLDIADGLATVDLSREFESGGGSASMFGRLAQVVYTLTQFPTVEGVAFRLDGRPVTVFSGEGIVLDGPSVRSDYEAFLPPVFVDSPAWGGTLANPGRVTGVANVFEATFMIELRDADGNRLFRDHAMATCGTGCWGTFDVTLRYDVARRQTGSLLVYVLSARDGSIESLRTYPVTLVP